MSHFDPTSEITDLWCWEYGQLTAPILCSETATAFKLPKTEERHLLQGYTCFPQTAWSTWANYGTIKTQRSPRLWPTKKYSALQLSMGPAKSFVDPA